MAIKSGSNRLDSNRLDSNRLDSNRLEYNMFDGFQKILTPSGYVQLSSVANQEITISNYNNKEAKAKIVREIGGAYFYECIMSDGDSIVMHPDSTLLLREEILHDNHQMSVSIKKHKLSDLLTVRYKKYISEVILNPDNITRDMLLVLMNRKELNIVHGKNSWNIYDRDNMTEEGAQQLRMLFLRAGEPVSVTSDSEGYKLVSYQDNLFDSGGTNIMRNTIIGIRKVESLSDRPIEGYTVETNSDYVINGYQFTL